MKALSIGLLPRACQKSWRACCSHFTWNPSKRHLSIASPLESSISQVESSSLKWIWLNNHPVRGLLSSCSQPLQRNLCLNTYSRLDLTTAWLNKKNCIDLKPTLALQLTLLKCVLEQGPAVTRINPDLETKSIRVLCNANTTEGYVPWKDASLPEINLVGGNIPAQLGGPSAQDRQHLAFFAGHDHGPVRPHLFKHWEGKDDDVRVYQSLPPQLNYHDLMKRSRYFSIPGSSSCRDTKRLR